MPNDLDSQYIKNKLDNIAEDVFMLNEKVSVINTKLFVGNGSESLMTRTSNLEHENKTLKQDVDVLYSRFEKMIGAILILLVGVILSAGAYWVDRTDRNISDKPAIVQSVDTKKTD